jgi:xanthine dehydrogenase accessory factor
MSEHARDGWEVIEQAAELARRGESFALATVVWRQGPSSSQQGSRAIVTTEGELLGWIGGACAEPTVIREAQRAIADGDPRLLLLGTPEQFHDIPEGMTAIPIACQSEGAMEIYIEPVVCHPHVIVVGRSPMAHTLCDLVRDLGWRADLIDAPAFTSADVEPRAAVIVATQGHGDEEALQQAVTGTPAFVGLVASQRRGKAVIGYLADRGVPRDRLATVRVPVGLDLGHTTHREIAVAVLAELVQLRAAGTWGGAPARRAAPQAAVALAVDPVCGMQVVADATSHPLVHAGLMYHFCGAGCRAAFERDPTAFVHDQSREATC